MQIDYGLMLQDIAVCIFIHNSTTSSAVGFIGHEESLVGDIDILRVDHPSVRVRENVNLRLRRRLTVFVLIIDNLQRCVVCEALFYLPVVETVVVVAADDDSLCFTVLLYEQVDFQQVVVTIVPIPLDHHLLTADECQPVEVSRPANLFVTSALSAVLLVIDIDIKAVTMNISVGWYLVVAVEYGLIGLDTDIVC